MCRVGAGPGEPRRELGEERFPKTARITARSEFLAIQERGRKVSLPGVLALWRGGGSRPARLGITASRRAGCAAERNAVKRWIREWFRRARTGLPAGLDLVLVVRAGACSAGHAALGRDLASLTRKLASIGAGAR